MKIVTNIGTATIGVVAMVRANARRELVQTATDRAVPRSLGEFMSLKTVLRELGRNDRLVDAAARTRCGSCFRLAAIPAATSLEVVGRRGEVRGWLLSGVAVGRQDKSNSSSQSDAVTSQPTRTSFQFASPCN